MLFEPLLEWSFDKLFKRLELLDERMRQIIVSKGWPRWMMFVVWLLVLQIIVAAIMCLFMFALFLLP